ncbi:hypothetical protein T08_10409 [Trichinella sp. T8]|nr:hypothetical protein T08_10409 [Trichinella sp. T8]
MYLLRISDLSLSAELLGSNGTCLNNSNNFRRDQGGLIRENNCLR